MWIRQLTDCNCRNKVITMGQCATYRRYGDKFMRYLQGSIYCRELLTQKLSLISIYVYSLHSKPPAFAFCTGGGTSPFHTLPLGLLMQPFLHLPPNG